MFSIGRPTSKTMWYLSWIFESGLEQSTSRSLTFSSMEMMFSVESVGDGDVNEQYDTETLGSLCFNGACPEYLRVTPSVSIVGVRCTPSPAFPATTPKSRVISACDATIWIVSVESKVSFSLPHCWAASIADRAVLDRPDSAASDPASRYPNLARPRRFPISPRFWGHRLLAFATSVWRAPWTEGTNWPDTPKIPRSRS